MVTSREIKNKYFTQVINMSSSRIWKFEGEKEKFQIELIGDPVSVFVDQKRMLFMIVPSGKIQKKLFLRLYKTHGQTPEFKLFTTGRITFPITIPSKHIILQSHFRGREGLVYFHQDVIENDGYFIGPSGYVRKMGNQIYIIYDIMSLNKREEVLLLKGLDISDDNRMFFC